MCCLLIPLKADKTEIAGINIGEVDCIRVSLPDTVVVPAVVVDTAADRRSVADKGPDIERASWSVVADIRKIAVPDSVPGIFFSAAEFLRYLLHVEAARSFSRFPVPGIDSRNAVSRKVAA